jgi:uncharacterized membrane protein YoaK (UPF0700 family)
VRLVVIALSFAGGTVDATAYLGLGHVFPANMTGNTVLMMIAVARGGSTELSRAAVALGAYCVGVALGTALLRHTSRWPRTAVITLSAEGAILALTLACWAAFGKGAHYGLIAGAAVAMGCQSAAVRASNVGGVSTTYVTGTLTTTVARVVERLRGVAQGAPASPALPGESWVVYACGGLAGAFATLAWHAGSLAIPLGLVLASAVTALTREQIEER